MINQQTPTLQDLLKEAIESRVTDIHVSLPGIVQKYDAAKQVADIQPVVKKKYADGTVVNLPLLINVPVIFPRTIKSFLHLPLAKNDYVLLIFCERSLDIWLQKGGIVDPDDFRKHSLSDAVALVGFFPQKNELTVDANNVMLVNDSAKFESTPDGKTKIGKVSGNQTENIVLGLEMKTYLETLHDKIATLLDKLILGDICLVTSPGSPTAPNPVRAAEFTSLKAELAALKASPISDKKFLSDIFFTEKGN
jgi:hypothetical protein